MKRSRWITFPLIFGILWTLQSFIFWEDVTLLRVVSQFVIGALMGFAGQAWSDHRARKRSGLNDSEEIYRVRQNRTVTVAGNRAKVMELCEAAVRDINSKHVKIDHEKGEIRAATKMNWDSFGTAITINVLEIGDNLSEVSIATRPAVRTTAVDYGRSWEAAERITTYLRRHDVPVRTDLLTTGAEILLAAPRRPIDIFPETRKKQHELIPDRKGPFPPNDICE